MVSESPIRILSVEDHPVFREGLSTIIGSQPDMLLVAQAGSAQEAISEFKIHHPDITLMDVRLPDTSGTDAVIAIRGKWPQARIIMLPTSDADAEIRRALGAGATGYLLKNTPKEALISVVPSVHSGRRHRPKWEEGLSNAAAVPRTPTEYADERRRYLVSHDPLSLHPSRNHVHSGKCL